MNKTDIPEIDDRTVEEIYRSLLDYASFYLNSGWVKQWPPNWENNSSEGYFNPEDQGLVLYKIFSQMVEDILLQLNRIPLKYQIAFYDFLGLALRTARSATAPVTFYPAKGIAEAYVPFGTRVFSKDLPDVIFETSRDLYVYPTYVSRFISYNPWIDLYEIHPEIKPDEDKVIEKGISLFAQGDLAERMPHRIYFSFGDKLNIQNYMGFELEITYQGEYSTDYATTAKSFFSKWVTGDGSPVQLLSEVTTDLQTLPDTYTTDFTFELLENSLSKVNEAEDFWLCCEPHDDVDLVADKDILPVLSDVKLSIGKQGLFPGRVYANRAPVDIKNGFYPFEEIPKVQNSFYIGSTEVFSRKGATVTLDISVMEGESDAESSPLLHWQYWNGIQWVNLEFTTDNTANFTGSPPAGNVVARQVVFECPADITICDIEGKSDWWIRVILTGGNYSKELSKTQDGVTLTYTEYFPPFIRDIKLGYQYTDVAPDKTICQNYYEYAQYSSVVGKEPYEIKENEKPAFYIGFDQVLPNIPLSLLSLVKLKIYGENIIKFENPFVSPAESAGKFEWQYYDGSTWVRLKGLEDETEYLEDEGTLTFTTPGDWTKTKVCEVEKHWLRLYGSSGDYFEDYKTRGLIANTIFAESGVTVTDEVLGSGNGKPGLSFGLSRAPVLAGHSLEVMENSYPSQPEVKEIIKEEGNDAIRVNIDDNSGEQETWVRWRPVKNFRQSGPRSRHYMINRASGKILFGDGERGCIPPAGIKNIIMRRYKSAGMKKSNLQKGAINSLISAIPGIDRVTNYSGASGGEDPETNTELMNRAPHTLQSRDRAVVRKDFEWLAKEADSSVAKVYCHGYPMENENSDIIEIVIIPEDSVLTPVPNSSLLRSVENYLKERTPVGVAELIEVTGPAYRIIEINLTYQAIDQVTAPRITRIIESEIVNYFHPLYGKQGRGWSFGEKIYSSEIGAAIEEIEGVDYIFSLSINIPGEASQQGISEIEIEKTQLPTTSAAHVTVSAQGAS